MAAKLEYQIVGRYMNGKSVTGYHLQCLTNDGKNGKYTKEQVCFLVGRGQITNCSGQLYKDQVLLRGEGISLEDLPVQQEDGRMSRTEAVGKVRRGATAADVMTQLLLAKTITHGRNVIGYVVTNAGGGTNNVARAQILELAKAGRIGNARYQESNGKPILRGVGINLNELPTVTAEELGLAPAKPKETPAKAAPVATPAQAPVAQTSAPKTNTQTTAHNFDDKQSQFCESDKALVVRFAKACNNTFKTVNKSLKNKLQAQGFYGADGVPNNDDLITMERFDYCVDGKPQEGGWIELIAHGTRRRVEFDVMVGDMDAETEYFSFTEEGFKQGWSWMVSRLRHYKAI